MTAIIFGANGQDGYYLQELLQKEQYNVIGISRSGGFLPTDVSEYSQVEELFREYKPDYIFHLAANSTTRHDALFENNSTISIGTLNILEAARKHSQHSKIFISGSGLQFKNVNRPIKETDDFEARDAYSVSRIHSVYAARYFRALGLKTYIGYFYNHDSPRRTERHMTKKIAEAARRIAAGSKEMLEVGDVSVIKEYTFAGDVVKAVWTLVKQDDIFEANLGSGLGYSIEQWLTACFTLIGKEWKDYVKSKQDFVAEYRQLVSDPTVINSIGWNPVVSFDDLAKMMMVS
jgi:GDPmannose 4,6-dehydratase